MAENSDSNPRRHSLAPDLADDPFGSNLFEEPSQNGNARTSRKRPLAELELSEEDEKANGRPPSKVAKTELPGSSSPQAEQPPHKLQGLAAYSKLCKLGEGTYGVVYMARDRRTSSFVALKRVRTRSEQQRTGFPLTSIREIKMLQNLEHPNIVSLREVVRSPSVGFVFLVLQYFEHDLASLVDAFRRQELSALSLSENKCVMLQVLSAVEHAHRHFVMHRDIKLSNLLINNHGVVALCDWGLARLFSHPLQRHTANVVTLWYRAPELLFGARAYHTAVDIWAVGCIFAELLRLRPLLPGQCELDQVRRIYELLGAPTKHIWPNHVALPKWREMQKEVHVDAERFKFNAIDSLFGKYGAHCLDLMKRLLAYDPSKRITASEAEQHPFFKEHPRACSRDMMPTFPTKHKPDI